LATTRVPWQPQSHIAQFDLQLARETADSCNEDELGSDLTETRKKNLWLRIARHVVEKEKDVKQYVHVF
jgi:hypothetical protein